MYSTKIHKRSSTRTAPSPSAHVARRGLTHKDEDGHDIVDDEDEFEAPAHIVECDEYCQARDKAIAAYEAKNGAISEEDDLDDDKDDDDDDL